MSRTCIIGDVHGMTDALKALVERLALQPDDVLISLGDLVDKGPDPLGTVRYLAGLWRSAPFQIVLVEANHEDRHLRYHRNLTERPKVAREMAEAAPELAELNALLSEDDRMFLRSASLFWRVPAHGVLCVHGGIPGNMQRFPATPEIAETWQKKDRSFLRQILRTRHVCGQTGAFLSLGKETESDPFWADIYDGRFGHVVFGHQPFFDGPREFPHATGIDTAAAHGGALTALVLGPGGDRSYVSITT